ncbi:MAG: hypothetical protein AB7N65_17700 [Vicinamibacterales bacterium]
METETAGIGALIGAGLPLIIAVINRRNWSARVASIVAFVVCLVAAAISTIFVDGIALGDPGLDLVAYFGTVYAAAMVSYEALWKPTKVAPSIEEKT